MKQQQKLKLCTFPNPKLLHYFPSDPNGDLKIIAGEQQFLLQKAYLIIQSNYFRNLQQGTEECQFQTCCSHIGMFYKVLRSMYGGQLQSSNILELIQVFSISRKLQIQVYKQQILQHLNKSTGYEALQFYLFYSSCKIIDMKDKWLLIIQQKGIQDLLKSKNIIALKNLKQQSLLDIINHFLKRYGNTIVKYVRQLIQTYIGLNCDIEAFIEEHRIFYNISGNNKEDIQRYVQKLVQQNIQLKQKLSQKQEEIQEIRRQHHQQKVKYQKEIAILLNNNNGQRTTVKQSKMQLQLTSLQIPNQMDEQIKNQQLDQDQQTELYKQSRSVLKATKVQDDMNSSVSEEYQKDKPIKAKIVPPIQKRRKRIF